MENLIKVNRPIFSVAREYSIGKGATLKVNLVCEPMIHFLCEEFDKNPYSLLGDIGSLKRRKIAIDLRSLKAKTNTQRQKYQLGALPKTAKKGL